MFTLFTPVLKRRDLLQNNLRYFHELPEFHIVEKSSLSYWVVVRDILLKFYWGISWQQSFPESLLVSLSMDSLR